jgi:hypothetical protein
MNINMTSLVLSLGCMCRRELDKREKDPAYVSDAYAECYPGYHEYAGTVVDSDEEDFTHMDGKEKGRSRIDFDTEEQWQVQNTRDPSTCTCSDDTLG